LRGSEVRVGGRAYRGTAVGVIVVVLDVEGGFEAFPFFGGEEVAKAGRTEVVVLVRTD
jgi:hypothetical protein